jgi:hypothetical protein
MMLQESAKYVIRFACEWGAGCLWPGNDAAYKDFDLGPYDLHDPCPLPLSKATLKRCRELDIWHRTSLNTDSTVQPGPWRQAECEQFNRAVAELVADLQSELGTSFQVINKQVPLVEDPDLDAYLANPSSFRRPGHS